MTYYDDLGTWSDYSDPPQNDWVKAFRILQLGREEGWSLIGFGTQPSQLRRSAMRAIGPKLDWGQELELFTRKMRPRGDLTENPVGWELWGKIR